MKSFHLDTTSKREVIQMVGALLIGVGLFFALEYFQITATVWRAVTLLSGAVFVGYLCRGHLCRSLRRKYPNARWIGLLAIGLSIASFWATARLVVPGAEDGSLTLVFIIPAGACIATFVFINRKDPNVTR